VVKPAMSTVLRRLTRLLQTLWKLLLQFVLAWKELAEALPTACRIIWRRVHNIIKEPPRQDSARRCMPVHEKVYRRPDPLIYSQQY
jgi:hypothetical protein